MSSPSRRMRLGAGCCCSLVRMARARGLGAEDRVEAGIAGVGGEQGR